MRRANGAHTGRQRELEIASDGWRNPEATIAAQELALQVLRECA